MTPEEKRILDIERIMPYDSKGTKGWLVRFNYYPNGARGGMKCHSKLFSWKKYGTPDAALDLARRYREEWLSKNRDILWLRGGGEYSHILPRNNTSGILGIDRVGRRLASGNDNYAWQAAVRCADGVKRSTRFAVKKHGELGALKKAIEYRLNGLRGLLASDRFKDDPTLSGVISYYGDILANIEDLKDQDSSRSVLEIVKDAEIDATSKYEQICVRVGQQRFRRQVMEYFESRCAVTGSSALIRASHIKPWRIASDPERLDYRNGLALSPSLDAAFDLGLISFGADGRILIAQPFLSDACRLGITPSMRLVRLTDGHIHYLDWHRKNAFDRGLPNGDAKTLVDATGLEPVTPSV